ncbi:hypothetical protein [Amycolatopsis sp. cmx-11-51]
MRTRMGVVYQPATARAVAEDAIRTAVTTKDNPADLIKRRVGGAGPGAV